MENSAHPSVAVDSRETILLMTATIEPPIDAPLLTRRDVPTRVADYSRAFTHYCRRLGKSGYGQIVFVDNSGADLGFLREIAEANRVLDRVELVSFRNLEAGATRFYGECTLLRHGFQLSRSLRQAEPGAVVWKVTGRYIVDNLNRIIREAPAGRDLYVHCRNRPIRYVDFGLAGFAVNSAPAILDRILAADCVRSKDESLIRELIDNGELAEFEIEPRFADIPDFVGHRGSDNADYRGPYYRAKYALRSIANRFLPSLWL